MKDVFILTNFSMYSESFSPIIVVRDQIKMFTEGGYKPTLIATELWQANDDPVFKNTKTEYIYHASSEEGQKVDENFKQEIEVLKKQLNDILTKDCVVVTHDLIFLPDYVKYNVAARELAEQRDDIHWIHWVHSATNPRALIEERERYGDTYKELLGKKFPNSTLAFPNSGDRERVAKNFNYEVNDIVEVPHPTDPVEYMHPVLKRLWHEKKLYYCDVLMSYPLRLDRGKQPDVNIRVLKGLIDFGLIAHLVFFDFHSTGGDKIEFRNELKDLAKELEIEDRITFISEFDDAFQTETPREIVRDFFELTDVMIMPSASETYSLVTQEAMAKGNLCILNHHFRPFESIYGDNAIYRAFNANIASDGSNGETTVQYDDINQYMKTIAGNIKYYLATNSVFRGRNWVRTHRNPNIVFEHYIEPLLYRDNNDA